MTLKEAHEIQRKELIALRRENARLKEGTYTDAEKLEHEKIIRHLRFENQTLAKDKERYHHLWRDALTRPAHQIEDLIKIDDLEKEIRSLKSANEQLSAQLQEAQDVIAKLKAQMNHDHENSSLPSSVKPFHKKIKNSRIATGRKPGAQSGHAGHKRPHMEPTRPVITLPPDPSILNNPDYYPTGQYLTKQVADLHISVSVTEYRSQIFRNRITGSRYHAPFPKGVTNEFNYGSNAKALAFLLNNYCNVSIDKTKELIQEVSDGKILLSKGLINSLPKQFSASTEKDRKHIYSMLLLAPSMHTDFTPGRVNGKCVQVSIYTNPDETLYCFSEHKGHQGIKGSPAENYMQILIHDHDLTFYNYGGDHQECLAHIQRYLQDAIDNEPDLTWHKQMKSLFSEIIHEAKQDRCFSPVRILQIEKEYDAIVQTAREEYKKHPPNKYFPDGFNLLERMAAYKKNHLLFLSHPEIEYTNNRAERGLRKFKRKLKQAVTFRCNHSIEDLCNCLSIIETRRQQGANLFLTTQEAFS